MKRFIAISAALALITALSATAGAIVDRSEEFYVADYANVLSAGTKSLIINSNGDLERECEGAQIVVVTVDYSEGMYTDDYALALMNDWGVGNAAESNGMLLLLIVKENKYWLMPGLGIKNSFSPAGNTIRDFENAFDAGLYDEAVASLFDRLLDWYSGFYGVASAGQAAQQTGPSYNNAPASGNYYSGEYYSSYNYNAARSLLYLMIVVFAVMIIISFANIRYRGVYYRRYGYYPRSFLPSMFFFGGRNIHHTYHRHSYRRPPYGRDDGRGGPPGRGGGGMGRGGGGFGGGGGMGRGGGGFGGGGGMGRR